MIRAIGSRDGKPLVLLGIDSRNIHRLVDLAKPIKVNLRFLAGQEKPTDLPDIDVVIFHASREAVDLLLAQGVVPEFLTEP